MKRFIVGFASTLLLIFAGCAESTDGDAAVADRSEAGSGEQTGEAEAADGAGVASQAPAVDGSSDNEVSRKTAERDGAAMDVGVKAHEPANDALKNFDAGIAAYEANNLPLAFEEFSTAAKKGHADSQYNLGLMYEQGIGTGKDESQAVAWYTKSANQGNSAAQFNLGVLHENGRGTKVDFAQANKWYRTASVQGDPLAIGNLGMLYVRGDGVPVNKEAGLALLFMSATLDSSPNNHARRNITSTRGLSAEVIANAQKFAGELSSSKNMLATLDQFLEQSTTP